jgi:hypothetical protein
MCLLFKNKIGVLAFLITVSIAYAGSCYILSNAVQCITNGDKCFSPVMMIDGKEARQEGTIRHVSGVIERCDSYPFGNTQCSNNGGSVQCVFMCEVPSPQIGGDSSYYTNRFNTPTAHLGTEPCSD